MSFSGYLIEQLQQMMIQMHESTGAGTESAVYEGIDAILSFLLGHHLLFDSRLKSKVQLSNSIYGEMPGPQGIMPLLGFEVLTNVNSRGKKEFRIMGAARHKQVELCLVSAYTLSLWFRFDFENGPLAGDKRPNFLDRNSWNCHKLLFQPNTNEPISADYDAQLIQKCLDSIGLSVRGNSPKSVLARVEEYQSSRAGPLERDVVENGSHSYLPLPFILFSSGFPKQQPYYISRNVTPPPELVKRIFPWVDELIPKAFKQEAEDLRNGIENDGMGSSFLETLQLLRPFILQDLAVLVDRAPNSYFCQHPITKDPLFIKFKKLVDASMAIPSTFEKLNESRVLPNIFSHNIPPSYDVVQSETERYNYIRKNRIDPDDDHTVALLEQIEQWAMRQPATSATQALWTMMQHEIVMEPLRR